MAGRSQPTCLSLRNKSQAVGSPTQLWHIAATSVSLSMELCGARIGGDGALTGSLTAPGNVAVMLPGAAVVCCEVTGVVTVPTAPGKAGGCLPEAGTALVPASALGAAGAGEGEVTGFTPLVPVLPVA